MFMWDFMVHIGQNKIVGLTSFEHNQSQNMNGVLK